MEISADQFARLVLAVLDKAKGKNFDVKDPKVLWSLVQEEYPSVKGVATPPSDSEVRKRFAGEMWEAYRPVRSRGELYPLLTIGPQSVMARNFRRQLERAGFAEGAMGVGTALMDGLERWRGNPMGSLGFVNALAAGQNPAEAMRSAALIADLHHFVSKSVQSAKKLKTSEKVADDVHRGKKPPKPWSDAEIRSRLAKGYHGGI